MRIELKDINKDFDGVKVLENINFEEEIKSLAIIGPSGGGKSTLLRIMGGLLLPTSGAMYMNKEKINFEEKDLHTYRKNIGFVFQTNGLFEHLTAMENVILPLIYTFNMNKLESVDIAKKLFDRFGLKGEINKYPFQLSGGQQQRISIARAIAVNPKFLLLDEPTSALDPEYTSEVLHMLGELQSEGLNTILVTHEMGFAKNACEQLMFLSNNKIIEAGKSNEKFKNPQSKELKVFLDKILEWRV